jgi:hypothetical protein
MPPRSVPSSAWDPALNKDYAGDRPSGWAEFLEKGVVNSARFTFRQKWEKGFPTETKKFEFYSETLKKGLETHAAKHKVTVDKVMEVTNYEGRGQLAFVPHYESPVRHGDRREYPFDLIDMKSRLNREGRSANCSWVTPSGNVIRATSMSRMSCRSIRDALQTRHQRRRHG